MRTVLRAFPLAALLLVAGALPVHAWSDIDVRLSLSENMNLNLLREGNVCAHQGDTHDGKYTDGDKIHISFVESGTDASNNCDTVDDKYIDLKLSDYDYGGVACNLRIGRHKNGEYYASGTSGKGYQCSSSMINGSMVVTVTYNSPS
jgi:hypothetical protein